MMVDGSALGIIELGVAEGLIDGSAVGVAVGVPNTNAAAVAKANPELGPIICWALVCKLVSNPPLLTALLSCKENASEGNGVESTRIV